VNPWGPLGEAKGVRRAVAVEKVGSGTVPAPVAVDVPGGDVGRQRARQEEALHDVDAQSAQRAELLRRLHTLGDHAHAEGMPHADDRADQVLGLVVDLDPGDEGAIDLEGIPGELGQP
jgi:hypothetical protein